MRKTLPVLYALICFMAIGYDSRCEVVDKIVVVVNNEVITQGEIDRVLAPVYYQYKSQYARDELIAKLEEARQKILGQIIDEKLLLGEAKRLNIEIDEKDVESKVLDAQKRMGSREAFERALAEQRLTPKELKARFRDQLMIRRLIDHKVGSKIMITPVDVSEYYRTHKDEFVQNEEVKLRNILIRPKEDMSREKALETAQDVAGRLKEGADFAELAMLYSDGPGAREGGQMGFVKKGDLIPEVEVAVFALKEGETSDMIQSGIGYHFFKVEERRQARTLSLSEARRSIEDAIFAERAREKMKGWIESLKKNAYIAFK